MLGTKEKMTKEAEWVIDQAKMLTLKELLYTLYTLREVIWEREC